MESRRQQSQQERSPDFPAYLLDLSIRNVRCFGPEEQTLRLSDSQGRPAQWTVILGDNGVGKTTLLQCLVALEPRRQFIRPRGHVISFAERPQVELPTNGGDGWRIYRDLPGETSIRGHLYVGRGLSPAEGPYWTSEVVVPTSSKRDWAPPDERFFDLRCCGYGATRRMGSAVLNRGPEDPAASLFLDYVTLIDAEEWLLVEDYARSRGDNGDESEQRLERIKKVLLDLLPDTEDLRIGDKTRTEAQRSTPSIELKTPYGWVALSDLSLGYRTMIAWAVDLASRLFMLYPQSPNPLAEPAVVLVDEVDLHLHPKWQRELRSHLTERFPNAQFVVTAHSPLVAQASENENIVVLRREGDHVVIDNDVETVRGWRVDQVLTSDLFGLKTARPPEYDDLIADRNALLSKRTLDPQDRAALKRLESQVVELPAGETPEDLEAMQIIREAAAKLRNS
ncbi:MAG TPA: AAA family ATPase [Thermoanaerobaculia bacterium]|jgi:energy-coupling factor transporter ATP-binding protein EcfA2|nr:AAA family ATPase [Thermoanaerobaculia bacterium]